MANQPNQPEWHPPLAEEVHPDVKFAIRQAYKYIYELRNASLPQGSGPASKLNVTSGSLVPQKNFLNDPPAPGGPGRKAPGNVNGYLGVLAWPQLSMAQTFTGGTLPSPTSALNAPGTLITVDSVVHINVGNGNWQPLTLDSTGVTPGTYGDGTHVPQITVGADGRVTLITNVPITGVGSSSVVVPMLSDDREDSDPFIVPGPPGPTGSVGPTGPMGSTGAPIFLDVEQPDEPMLIPGPPGPSGSVGSGSLVLLEEHTASSSVSLNFTTRNIPGQSGATIQSDFDEYLIELLNLIPASNARLGMRMSTNGGSSYDNGTNYSSDEFTWRAGGTAPSGGTGLTTIAFGNPSVGQDSTSTFGMVGTLTLFNPGSSVLYKQVQGQFRAIGSGIRYASQASGAYEVTTAVNAFQFYFDSSGSVNMTSGTIRVYGIAK